MFDFVDGASADALVLASGKVLASIPLGIFSTARQLRVNGGGDIVRTIKTDAPRT